MGSTSTNNWLGFASFSAAADDAAILPPLPFRGDEATPAPKLEDFLVGMQESSPAAAVAAGRPFAGTGGAAASSIGLSMIKNWLRSQPAPAVEDSTALVAASPEGSEKVVVHGAESGGAAVVDVAQQRKAAAVDTFGQRTSIYRGVTKKSSGFSRGGHMTVTNLLTDGIGSYGRESYGYSGWPPSSMTPIPLQFSNGHDHSKLWCKPEHDSAVGAAAQNLQHLQRLPAPGGTHNFFQPSPHQEVTGATDVSSPSVDSNSFLYNGGVGYYPGAMGGGYPLPVATLVDCNPMASGYGVEEGTASDIYGGRNLYYLSQGSPGSNIGKADAYDQQGVEYDSWVPSVPVISQKPSSNVTICSGTPLFSVWK
ncbi:hypothetical protein HU200_008708 [Digitaria exilis]|uniref:Uncharacterized protein n=1 Tax=Digitaria exilis TaxID=1010633 RepID=A0A835KTD8_9POAL|nr:hypothetical protein HU200_008708 [Digitaria exilis]